MSFDLAFMSDILNVFTNTQTTTVTIKDIYHAGLWSEEGEEEAKSHGDKDPKFKDHMQELYRLGFIEHQKGNSGIGLHEEHDGSWSWSVVPLVITEAGLAFLQSSQT
ncbi:MAG TPA: hypothetical protein VIZ65_14385 [Cellvibrionaceae bacterium]